MYELIHFCKQLRYLVLNDFFFFRQSLLTYVCKCLTKSIGLIIVHNIVRVSQKLIIRILNFIIVIYVNRGSFVFIKLLKSFCEFFVIYNKWHFVCLHANLIIFRKQSINSFSSIKDIKNMIVIENVLVNNLQHVKIYMVLNDVSRFWRNGTNFSHNFCIIKILYFEKRFSVVFGSFTDKIIQVFHDSKQRSMHAKKFKICHIFTLKQFVITV